MPPTTTDNDDDLVMLDAAKARLRDALPHIKLALSMARLKVPDGKVGIAVIAKAPNGTGMITASFEADEFIKDVELVSGWKEHVMAPYATRLTNDDT